MNLRGLATVTVVTLGLAAGASLPSGPSLAKTDLSDLDALMTLARQAETDGRDRRAVALYRRAHDLYPMDSAPLAAWGHLALRVGAPERALALFEAALSVDPDDSGARHGLATAHVDLDEADAALAQYETLVGWDAGDYRAWNGKGVALDMLARHDEAQTAYRKGLAVAPGNPNLARNLTLSLARGAGQSDGAPAVVTTVATKPVAQ